MNYYIIAFVIVWGACIPAVFKLAGRAFDDIYEAQKRFLPHEEMFRNCNYISIVYVFCGMTFGPFWVIPMLIIQNRRKKNKVRTIS